MENLFIFNWQAYAFQKLLNLFEEESPRISLVKGERYVRHDDTSEGEQPVRLLETIQSTVSYFWPRLREEKKKLMRKKESGTGCHEGLFTRGARSILKKHWWSTRVGQMRVQGICRMSQRRVVVCRDKKPAWLCAGNNKFKASGRKRIRRPSFPSPCSPLAMLSIEVACLLWSGMPRA